MNTIPGNNGVGSGVADVVTPTLPLTMRQQMALDNDAFYDTTGGGFAIEASYQTKGNPAVMIRGIVERKPVEVDVFGNVETYKLTFRSPNMEVNGARQGALMVIERKTHFVTHVEKDSNGDTILTLSQNDYANASTPTNR